MTNAMAYKGYKNSHETITHNLQACCPNSLLFCQALGLDPRDDNYVLDVVGIFGGFYILFFTERVLKIVLKADAEVRA